MQNKVSTKDWVNKSFGKEAQRVTKEQPRKDNNNDHEKIDNTRKDNEKQVEAAVTPTKDKDKQHSQDQQQR